MDITQRLFALQDEGYRDFSSKLIPNISPDTMIGVRLPNIRKLANELVKSGEHREFLDALPHKYIEEYHLHSFIVSSMKDIDTCINEIDKLLPYIDNWSVCDSLRPKCFAKNTEKAYLYIKKCMSVDSTYTKRFAIEMLMTYFLGEHFSSEHLDIVASVEGEDYYLKMMVAWYFATALAKQYEVTVPYIQNNIIQDKWTHNKAIQKALESYRISEDKKQRLKTLKR